VPCPVRRRGVIAVLSDLSYPPHMNSPNAWPDQAYRDLEIKGLVAGRPDQGMLIQAALSQVALPELTGLRRSLLRWLASADTTGPDEDGIAAPFREHLGSPRDRRGATSSEAEGVA